MSDHHQQPETDPPPHSLRSASAFVSSPILVDPLDTQVGIPTLPSQHSPHHPGSPPPLKNVGSGSSHQRSRTVQIDDIDTPAPNVKPFPRYDPQRQILHPRYLRSSISNAPASTPRTRNASGSPQSNSQARAPHSPDVLITVPDPESFLRLAAGVVKGRQGSVLSRGSLLKTDHWASGKSSDELIHQLIPQSSIP